MLVARTGYTGEDGFEFYVAPDAAPELWQAIVETGAGSGLVPAGLAARDTLRLEAGMPLYGHELSTETFPVQAGLGRVVALKTKEGDFVGRTAVEDGPADGARMLVGLRSDGKRAGRAGYPVMQGDARGRRSHFGRASRRHSATRSPWRTSTPAVAEAADLELDVRGSRIPASVTPLPFYKKES